jgi:uncharacterized protein DUF3592
MAVFLGGFVGVGGRVLFWEGGVREWRAARGSEAWLPVPGRVVQVMARSRSRTPTVAYDYEHGGGRFRSTHVLFGATSAGEMTEFLAAHPVGSAVTVYVDPAAPERAVLERRLGSRWFVMPAFGLVLALVGLAAVRYMWRATAPGAS